MGMSAASEPLNFFIIVMYETYSFLYFFMTASLKTVALATSQIYLTDITDIDKICDFVNICNKLATISMQTH